MPRTSPSGRALLCVALALGVLPVAAQPAADWQTSVSAFAARIVDNGLAPGIGMAVAIDDRVEYADAFGIADQETGLSAGPSTAFYIASSTKSLTAFAAVLLAERGALDLHAPISRYLPTLRLAAPLNADSITVEDLLTLTHGIRDGGPVVIRTAYTGEFTTDKLLGLMASYPPAEQGRAFVYGNLGYNLLGLVLEAQTGRPWQEIVDAEVLRPLRMTSTTARVSQIAIERQAFPHGFSPDGFDRIRLGKTDANMHAAGGHFATPTDLARYVAVHQSGGILEGKRLFPARTVDETHRMHVTQDREFGPIHRYGWGYGWDLGVLDGDTLVHRFGSFAGYRSHMSFMPAHRVGVVVLVNGDGPASDAADLLASFAYDLLLGKDDAMARAEDKLAKLASAATNGRAAFRQALETRASRQQPLPRPLSDYEGSYESPALGRLTLSVVGTRLEASMGAAWSVVEVFDAATNRLRVELTGGGSVVQVTFDDTGSPARSISFGGEEFVRVE